MTRTSSYVWRVTGSLVGLMSLLLMLLVILLTVQSYRSGVDWLNCVGFRHSNGGGQFYAPRIDALGGRVEIFLQTGVSDTREHFYESAAYFGYGAASSPGFPDFAYVSPPRAIEPGVYYQSEAVSPFGPWNTTWYRSLRMPLWLPAIFGLPGVIWLLATIRALRRSRNAHDGHCYKCGYDLRASPGVCPECGSSPPVRPLTPLRLMLPVGAAVTGIVLALACALVVGEYFVHREQLQIQRILQARSRADQASRTGDADGMLAAVTDGADQPLSKLLPDFDKPGNFSMLQELIRAGVDVNTVDANGRAPLEIAVAGGNARIVQCLLDGGASVRVAAGERSLLLEISPDAPDSAEILRLLVAHHIDMEWRRDGRTSLLQVVADGKIGMSRLLLEAGANPDARVEADDPAATDPGLTPLLIVTSELEIRAIPQSERCALARLLLAHRANVNARGPNGRTALHGAVNLRMDDLARLLVDGGADRSIRDNSGERPVDLLEDYPPETRQRLTPAPDVSSQLMQ